MKKEIKPAEDLRALSEIWPEALAKAVDAFCDGSDDGALGPAVEFKLHDKEG